MAKLVLEVSFDPTEKAQKIKDIQGLIALREERIKQINKELMCSNSDKDLLDEEMGVIRETIIVYSAVLKAVESV